MESKRLIVVLGMHRSGSSAITKGLEVMGVNLGSHLMSADANNEKGYFEDIALNQINTEILEASGHSWNSLSLIKDNDLLSDKFTGLKDRATEILKEKLAGAEILGIKDPRFCRLLPFWKDVFNDLKLDVSYVIILRNPESIAASLFARDAYPRVKSLYLWLEYMVPVFRETRAFKRSVVDFDQLVAHPKAVIEALAEDLKLSGQLNQDALKSYEKEFIDTSLKHHRREAGSKNGFTSRLISQLDVLLNDVSEQRVSIDSSEFMDGIDEIEKEFRDKSDILAYIDTLDSIILRDHFSLKNANTQLDNLTTNYDQAKEALESKKKIVTKRNLQIKGFKADIVDRDESLASLQHALSDRDLKVENLENFLSDRDLKIEALEGSLHAKKKKINTYKNQIYNQQQQIESDESDIEALATQLEEIKSSLFWRLSVISRKFWHYFELVFTSKK